MIFCSVDASKTKDRIGCYVNDSKNQNCHTKVISDERGTPFICIFASKDIPKDTELRYDYRDRKLRWRKVISKKKSRYTVEIY